MNASDEPNKDALLIFGVATDDAHHYRDFTPHLLNPGRAWVVVRAVGLTSKAIVEALASGDFYASNGVTLAELEMSHESILLRIEEQKEAMYATSVVSRICPYNERLHERWREAPE